jgi:hypothetical protein
VNVWEAERKEGNGRGTERRKTGLTVRCDPIRREDLIMTDQTGLVERTSVDGPVGFSRIRIIVTKRSFVIQRTPGNILELQP